MRGLFAFSLPPKQSTIANILLSLSDYGGRLIHIYHPPIGPAPARGEG